MAKVSEAVQVAKEQTNRELGKEAMAALRQLGVVLANSPTVQMIVGILAVELLQLIKYNKQVAENTYQVTPLISDELANTMTGFIFGGAAVSAIEDIVENVLPWFN